MTTATLNDVKSNPIGHGRYSIVVGETGERSVVDFGCVDSFDQAVKTIETEIRENRADYGLVYCGVRGYAVARVSA